MSLDEGRTDADDPPRSASPAARRRPLLVALLYGHRALGALLIAAPISVALGDLVAGYPRGDAELFDAGGVMLVEAARLARPFFGPLAVQGGLVALLFVLLGFFPLAALIAGLGRDGKLSARFLAGRAVSSFSALVLLAGVALFAEAVIAVLLLLLGQKAIEIAGLGLRAGDIARAALVIVALIAALAVGIIHDLARVAVVHQGRRFYMASARALRVFGARFGRVLAAYLARSALALVVILAAAWLAERLGVATRSRLVLAALIHQAAIIAAVFFRASWLGAAIALLDEVDAEAPRSPPPPVSVEGDLPATTEGDPPVSAKGEERDEPSSAKGDQIGCEDGGA